MSRRARAFTPREISFRPARVTKRKTFRGFFFLRKDDNRQFFRVFKWHRHRSLGDVYAVVRNDNCPTNGFPTDRMSCKDDIDNFQNKKFDDSTSCPVALLDGTRLRNRRHLGAFAFRATTSRIQIEFENYRENTTRTFEKSLTWHYDIEGFKANSTSRSTNVNIFYRVNFVSVILSNLVVLNCYVEKNIIIP